MFKFRTFKALALGVIAALCASCTVKQSAVEASSETDNAKVDVTDEILYIQIAENHSEKKTDIVRIYSAIANFDQALSEGDLDEAERLQVRFWRGNAYSLLNQLRRDNGDDANASEVEKALADYDYVIASNDADLYPRALYRAGYTAYNDLRDDTRAGRYWLKCAETEHAGCMNVAADGFFSGQYGFSQDYSRSRDFHVKTFNTGTDYVCAGAYSGMALARMAVFLPEVGYQLTWDEWLKETLKLQAQVADLYELPNACALEVQKIRAYLLELANGENYQSLLTEVVSSGSDAPSSAIANYFLGDANRQSVIDILQDQSDFIKCQSAVSLITHSTITANAETAALDKKLIFEIDPKFCANGRQWAYIFENYN